MGERATLTSERKNRFDERERKRQASKSEVAEALRKRKYPKAFVSKLSDSEGEAAETQVWLDYALECKYIDMQLYEKLNDKYDHIIAMLVNMANKPENWSF